MSGPRVGRLRGYALLLFGAVLTLPAVTIAFDTPDRVAADAQWLAVPAQSLQVAAGSALDLSALVATPPAGDHGGLQLRDGTLRFADGVAPRFNCGLVANGANGSWDWPTHAEADVFTEQLRRHGYNLVRFHFVDTRLMRGAKGDLDIDPEALDRFQYQLASLKKAGIYWMLDMLTAPNGGPDKNRWATSGGDSLKVRMIFDPVAQARWLAQVDAIYGRVNPYTGRSPLADPALAFVIGANENSLAFAARNAIPAGLAPLFDRWLRARFGDPAALAGAIPDLTGAERAGGTLAPPVRWDGGSPRAIWFRRFASDLEVASYRRITDALGRRGYRGPILAYPEWYAGQNNATRARLPITDIHAYVGEVVSYAPGTTMLLPSSTSDQGLNAWTNNAGARWLDRPMVASEYGFPIPNPYRYEGALFPAIAAMQGYAAICRMANSPIELAMPGAGRPMQGYSVGLDPVGRATETLATLLFFRGDMPALRGTLAVPFGKDDFARPGSAYLPGGLRRASLLVRFGMIPPDKAASLPRPGIVVPATPGANGWTDRALAKVANLFGGTTLRQSGAMIQALRGAGLLPKDNPSDATAGRYRNRDGTLDIDQRAGTIRIATPRTQAFSSIGAIDSARFGDLELLSLGHGALVAAAALDGQPLAQSRRILLILTGDARNSGLRLIGEGTSRTLGDWGRLPILLQRVTARLALRNGAAGQPRLDALSLAGQPTGTLPVTRTPDGRLHLRLDTGAVAGQPTTYFLLTMAAASARDAS